MAETMPDDSRAAAGLRKLNAETARRNRGGTKCNGAKNDADSYAEND